MSDKKGISPMHDKKPLNKTNYTPLSRKAQCPKKLHTAYDDREEKTTETQKWKKSVPHINNTNILLLKTPPRVYCSAAEIVCKECMATSDEYLGWHFGWESSTINKA